MRLRISLAALLVKVTARMLRVSTLSWLKQPGYAVHQYAGFAATSAGEHQDIAPRRTHRALLLFIEFG